MKKLRPVDHDTQLIYECPGCGFKHWKLLSEVTRPHAAIHCHCGEVSQIEQLTQPRFVAKFVKSSIKPTKPKPNQTEIVKPVDTSLDDMERAKRLVTAQGFTAKEAEGMLHDALLKHPKDYKELVRLAIAGATNGTETSTI